ncbi:echinoidin-like [Patiria miniata]|uniref:C-type lectin domain-containing protein n=1 Tax=Patiria miniata TaxID=46514 RepID=A0A913Z614_PATMI|nr:echinoidin-like [Patiria miniata]
MAMLQVVSLLTLAALAAAQCPDDFTAFGNNACYMPVAQKLPWHEAEQFCNAYSSCASSGLGNLVSIHTEQENRFVHMLYNTLVFNTPENFWIGYNDRRTEGQFEWSDGWTYPPGTTPFSKWFTPPGAFSNEDCVSMDGSSTVPGRQPQPGRNPEMWQLRDCTTPLAFVCIIEDAPSMECPAINVPSSRPGV